MKVNKFVLLFGMTLLTIQLMAQPTPEDPPEEQVPVDGGITALVGLGAAWGIKLLRDKKNK